MLRTRMKRKAALMAIAILLIVAFVGSAIFWLFVMPNVDFWLNPTNTYQKVADNWVTTTYDNNSSVSGCLIPIGCKNNGALTATFQITIVFSGASFSTETPMPYQQINTTAAKFTFTLNSYQERNVNVYFTITNTTRFNISLSLQTNQSLLRITNAQKSSPWDSSYRELYYSLIGDKFVPAQIS